MFELFLNPWWFSMLPVINIQSLLRWFARGPVLRHEPGSVYVVELTVLFC